MKSIQITKDKVGTSILILFLLLVTCLGNAQVKYSAKDDLNLLVSGTSTLHDWDMKEAKGECIATFTLNAAGQITGLTALSFTAPAEGLKSEHTGMDKNAYKALKTSKNPNISFKLTSATVAPDGTIKCTGKLTIAGVTLDTDLVAIAKVNADKSITVSGKKNISMKDFQMEPPTFMMGTIKTGNDIVFKFDIALRK
jgi:hypothetical protein